MLKISLIVATFGRAAELETLFRSLEMQEYTSFEVIVVDQNSDNRVAKIVDRWSSVLPLKRVTSSPGLSIARNVGLSYATGEIVAFPDDDCWYSESLLLNVSEWFATNANFGVLTVGAQDVDGVASGNRWIQDRCEIRPINAFRTTFSSTIFVRRGAAMRDVRFDEGLGVGSGAPFLCGEETDYVLNILRNGARGYFDRSWYIGHPKRDMLSGKIDRRRAAGYGCGMGRVLRKHSQPALLCGFVAYDLARWAAVGIRGESEAARLCLRHAYGIVCGFLGRPAQQLRGSSGVLHHLPSRIAAFVARLGAAEPQHLNR
jgi:glycosyltransferase involved in cell wall biosynthesis